MEERVPVDVGRVDVRARQPAGQRGSDRAAAAAEIESSRRSRRHVGLGELYCSVDECFGAAPRDEGRWADRHRDAGELRHPDDVLEGKPAAAPLDRDAPVVGVGEGGEDALRLAFGEGASGGAK